MRLVYLPANMAWVFLFGEDINTATIQDMAGYGRFFTSRGEAVQVARDLGLVVSPKGIVSTREDARD